MTISENTFTGEFKYTLDSKSRLNIPSKFRSALSPDNDGSFIITKGMDNCIIVYPLVEWQKRVESCLRELSATSQRNRLFVRSITRYASTVKLDGQGRIQLTPYLKDFANLDREVQIIGVVNKIELWNPKNLEKLDELSPHDFDDLSEKVIL